MWSVVLTLVGVEDAPFKVFDSRSEAEEFRDEVEKAMDYKRLIRFERNGRKYTVGGAHVAMVEMYQAYRGEKIW